MATPQELISLFGDDFDEVLKGLNALPPEVKKLLDDTLGKLVYDAEVFGQRINKTVQTRGARGISLSNISGSLATDMQNKGRIFGELKNSIKESLVEGVNQSGQAGTFQAYDPDEKTIFTWITVAGHKICGDCSPRGGQKATLAEWEEQGMPATGWSVCGGYCYCILDPSGKLSPRIEFQEVQEKGATIRPKPTPPAAPLPKPAPTIPKKVSTSNKPLQKKGLRSENLSTQQRLENLLTEAEIKKDGNFLLGWKKDYITSAKKNQPARKLNFDNTKNYMTERLSKSLKELESAKAKGISGLENRIVELKDQLKLYKNKNFNKWSTSSFADDPLYATTKHEAWHQIDYQLSSKPLTGKKNGNGGLFQQKLNKYNVDREQWYEVSEYAHHNIHELWAETGTALDLGFFVPENIKKAFIETIQAVGYSYP